MKKQVIAATIGALPSLKSVSATRQTRLARFNSSAMQVKPRLLRLNNGHSAKSK
jgi:hypothetical protein